MADTPSLAVQLNGRYLVLDKCISFRFEKERYSPCTVLTGKWYCNEYDIDEIYSLTFSINGIVLHFGFPSTGTEIAVENGRRVLVVNSRGYSQALAQNQPTPGLVSNVSLVSLATSAMACPNVSYEPNSPVVRYVNYYDGTSIWDAIVCYSIRATGTYPYIRGTNTVNISAIPQDIGTVIVNPWNIISRGEGSDYSNLISEISETSYAGANGEYVVQNQAAISRNIIRKKEIPFDHEWVMDSELGLITRLNYSMRGMYYVKFKYYGYTGGDIMDNFVVNYENRLPYIGRISRLVLEGSNGNVFTTVYCYLDAYCG